MFVFVGVSRCFILGFANEFEGFVYAPLSGSDICRYCTLLLKNRVGCFSLLLRCLERASVTTRRPQSYSSPSSTSSSSSNESSSSSFIDRPSEPRIFLFPAFACSRMIFLDSLAMS